MIGATCFLMAGSDTNLFCLRISGDEEVKMVTVEAWLYCVWGVGGIVQVETQGNVLLSYVYLKR